MPASALVASPEGLVYCEITREGEITLMIEAEKSYVKYIYIYIYIYIYRERERVLFKSCINSLYFMQVRVIPCEFKCFSMK